MSANVYYDDRSGQVYTETSALVTSMVPAWVSSRPGSKHHLEKYRHKWPGAPSLLDMSFRCLAWNGFDMDSLEYLDWLLGEKFYTWLKNKNLVSFKDWLAFREAYPNSKVIDRDFSLYIFSAGRQDFSRDLPLLTKHLKSLPQTSLTYLCLQNLSFSATDLMRLTAMPNIAVLILQQNSLMTMGKNHNNGIHDHFMGSWRRAISEKNSFSKLGVMAFRGFHTGLSATFSCFSVFPKLRLCNFEPGHVNQGFDRSEAQHQSLGDWERLPRLRVSVNYGDNGLYETQYNTSAWYIRIHPPTQASLGSTKRARDEPDTTTDPGQKPKKRNIKSGKQKSIGDMLGGFIM
ncbi:hypothetical protein DM02DRAFT_630881 [Periconia macrospinosa]|uniref:Uncharacterized protein n=1 Tax=Periconia macrospinosa TaxID=97972 RepID=A0A2V1DIK3_9PLEO|nr:hypothetical protein DM02DRAFT_630881 [Periconia macrospinosa]